MAPYFDARVHGVDNDTAHARESVSRVRVRAARHPLHGRAQTRLAELGESRENEPIRRLTDADTDRAIREALNRGIRRV